MSKHKKTVTAKTVRTMAAGMLSVVAAFAVGLRTAGEVETIAPIEANELAILAGDMNADGSVDELDVSLALELSEGYEPVTPQHLKADPNRDGAITAADALTILKMIDASL